MSLIGASSQSPLDPLEGQVLPNGLELLTGVGVGAPLLPTLLHKLQGLREHLQERFTFLESSKKNYIFDNLFEA
jgi:hypothetical protein